MISFSPVFRDDLKYWCKKNPKGAEKIFDLIEAIDRDPVNGIGKPEPLKYQESNLWSRRIDLEHRLVYRVTDDRIDFLSCRYHYES